MMKYLCYNNDNPDMNVIYNLQEEHVKQLHSLYQNEWWTKSRTLDETRNGVLGSQISIALVEKNNLVGFCRVLTDFTFKAFIFDVIVHPEHRQKHLGKQLINLVLSHKKIQKVQHIELYCLPELEPYYAQFHFDKNVGGMGLMRRHKSSSI